MLAWGALAFGSEYSWAYAPLLVLCVLTAILAARTPAREASASPRPLIFALAAVFTAGAVPLLPVPAALHAAVSARAPAVDYGRLYTHVTMLPSSDWMPSGTLSIAPARTLLGLTFLMAFAALLVGCGRAMGIRGSHPVVRGIVVLGVVVAFVGLIQAGAESRLVYGFFRPPNRWKPFAPFINENHFAGWMVMVLSMALGWLAGAVAKSMRALPPGWRHRALWLSSPEASEIMLVAIAIVIMAIAIVITGSRGGLVGLAAAAVIFGGWVIRRQPSKIGALISVTLLIAVLLSAAARGGAATTLGHFRDADVDWGGRRDIWLDAARIVYDYPLSGTGLNTFGVAMLHYQTGVPDMRVIEAHNDYLQLAVEGGLLLGIPALVAIGVVIREIWSRFREGADDTRTYWVRAGAVTGLGSIAVMEIFDFTLQMPGAAAMFVVLTAIAIHKPHDLGRGSTRIA